MPLSIRATQPRNPCTCHVHQVWCTLVNPLQTQSGVLRVLSKLDSSQQADHHLLSGHTESAGAVRALLQNLCMTAEKRGEQLTDDLADLLSAMLVSLLTA